MNLPTRCDYIVVGGGSAGCVLANRLSADPAKTVLLIEAGGDHSPFRHPGEFLSYAMIGMPAGYARLLNDRRFDWMDRTEADPPSGGRTHKWSRGRVLGGGSSINGSIYMRGQAEDYDRWRQLGCEGWSYRDVLPYFRKAEDQQRGADEFHGAGGPLTVSDVTETHPVSDAVIAAAAQAGIPLNRDFNGAAQEGAGYFQLTQRNGRRCSAAVAYIDPARARRNLIIATGILVERVAIEGHRATGVIVRIDGESRFIEARGEVILSAGALGSPRVLELSGIGSGAVLRDAGITVTADLPGVGENLQDHYTCAMMWRLRPGVPSANSLSRGVPLTRELCKYLFGGKGLLTLSPGNVGIFCKSRPDAATPDIQFHSFPANPDLTADTPSSLVLDREPGLTSAFNVLRPQSRGSTHIRNAFPDEPLSIRPNYLAEPADQDVIVAAFQWSRRIARQDALAAIIAHEILPGPAVGEEEGAILAYCRASGGTGYHPAGTCAMGETRGAVTDHRLRVRGIAGLRVADASVMPTLVSGNTNAPTIMIAEKAADMIHEDARRENSS